MSSLQHSKMTPVPPEIKALLEQADRLFDQANFPLARALYERALMTAQETIGDQHPETARILSGLAKSLARFGEYAAAEEHARRSLNIRRQAYGTRHADTAESLHVLAEILSERGEFNLAREMVAQAYTVRRQVLGPGHADTLESQKNLALMLALDGRNAEAKQLLAEALGVCEAVHGEENRATAKVLNALALLYARQDTTRPQARQLYERSLTIHERIHPFHPETAVLQNNLAAFLADSGELDRAAGLCERSLSLHEQIYGPKNVYLVPVLINLADIYKSQKNYEAARPLYSRALIIAEPVLGARHPQTMRSLKKLVALYGLLNKQGDKQAIANGATLYVCMISLEAANGPLPPEKQNMPGAHLDPDEAARRLHEFVKRLETEYNRQPLSADEQAGLQTARQKWEEADRAFQRGDYALAESLLERALEIQQQILGMKHYEQIEPLQKLAKVKEKVGQPSKVLPLLEQVADIHMEVYGPEHPHTLLALSALQSRYYYEYGPQASLPLTEKIVQLQEKALGTNDPHVRMMKASLEHRREFAEKEEFHSEQPARSRSQKREDALRTLPPERQAILAGIDEISWHDLKHAYGPADDVPDQLRLLLCDDPSMQEDAWESLSSNIWHQGDVYEASAFTIPFFLRMLAFDGPPEKTSILESLLYLVEGHSYFGSHTFTAEEKGRWETVLAKEGRNLEDEIEKGRAAVEAINQAACEGIPLYFNLLNHPDLEVRLQSLKLLAVLRDRSEQIVPPLLERFAGVQNDREHTTTLETLDAQMDDSLVSQQFFTRVMQTDPDKHCRFIGAIALVKRTGTDASESAIRVILDSLIERSRISRKDLLAANDPSGWTWIDLHAGISALVCLEPERAVPNLIELLSTTQDPEEAVQIADLLLGVVFNSGELSLRQPGVQGRGKGKPPRLMYAHYLRGSELPPPITDLAKIQLEALKAILAHDPVWVCEHDLLTLYGLPDTRPDLAQFIQGIED